MRPPARRAASASVATSVDSDRVSGGDPVSRLAEYAPWFLAMAILVSASAFFSASEAALFYLSQAQRRRLATGNRFQRAAAELLSEPDRLLGAVLFWNLVVNLAYFATSSVLSLRLESARRSGEAGTVAAGSVVLLIVFGEMLPKSLAVLRGQRLAAWIAVPLGAMARLVDPVLPMLQGVCLLSRRLIWPGFGPEPYLRVRDLERAVELSTADAALVGLEQRALQRIVQLSEMRVDELMRPRRQLRVFHPPVRLADLAGAPPRSGYVLIAEADGDEIAAAAPSASLVESADEAIEPPAQPVLYVPWCAAAAEALEQMRRQRNPVAAVVNEYGETIGALTLDDILETIFGPEPSRSLRLLRRRPILQVAPGVWHVTGMTSLWRLSRYFGVERPPGRNVTVAGAVQEALGALPSPGDECRWGPFHLKVVEAPRRGAMLVELRLAEPREEPS